MHLAGKALTVFRHAVPTTILGDCKTVKSHFLDAMGDTVKHAELSWWSLKHNPGET